MGAHARVCVCACVVRARKPLVYVRVRMHGYAIAHVRMVIMDCHFSLRGIIDVFENACHY